MILVMMRVVSECNISQSCFDDILYPVIHPFMDDFSCVSFWELLYQFVCYYFPLGFACSLLHNKLI